MFHIIQSIHHIVSKVCDCVFSFADASDIYDASDAFDASDACDAVTDMGASDANEALKASDGDIEVIYINL